MSSLYPTNVFKKICVSQMIKFSFVNDSVEKKYSIKGHQSKANAKNYIIV